MERLELGKILKVILGLLTIIILLIGIGFYSSYSENRALEDQYFSLGEEKVISLDLEKYPDLPKPVRRYFEYAFQGKKEVTARPIHWQEKGEFLLPVGEFVVNGSQVSRPNQPLYQWEGVYYKGGWLPFLESRDVFYLYGHNMRAKIFSWFAVMTTNYNPEDEKQLHNYLALRYYGTAVKFPWALLPDSYKKWEPKNENQAYLVLQGDLKGRYLVTFNEQNQIIRMETEDVMMHGNHEWLREVGEKKNYKLVEGFYVPTRMEYTWYDRENKRNTKYFFDVLEIRY